jgi:hypothetical protein
MLAIAKRCCKAQISFAGAKGNRTSIYIQLKPTCVIALFIYACDRFLGSFP